MPHLMDPNSMDDQQLPLLFHVPFGRSFLSCERKMQVASSGADSLKLSFSYNCEMRLFSPKRFRSQGMRLE